MPPSSRFGHDAVLLAAADVVVGCEPVHVRAGHLHRALYDGPLPEPPWQSTSLSFGTHGE